MQIVPVPVNSSEHCTRIFHKNNLFMSFNAAMRLHRIWLNRKSICDLRNSFDLKITPHQSDKIRNRQRWVGESQTRIEKKTERKTREIFFARHCVCYRLVINFHRPWQREEKRRTIFVSVCSMLITMRPRRLGELKSVAHKSSSLFKFWLWWHPPVNSNH